MEAHYVWECKCCGFWYAYKGENDTCVCPGCGGGPDMIHPMHKGTLYWHLLDHGELTEKAWKEGLRCDVGRAKKGVDPRSDQEVKNESPSSRLSGREEVDYGPKLQLDQRPSREKEGQ